MKKRYAYFWLTGVGPSSGGGFAIAPPYYDSLEERGKTGIHRRTINSFQGLDEIPCIFEISKGLLLDYLQNDIDYPLFSHKLKEIIDANVTTKLYRWIKAKIRDTRTNEIIIYYMPIFEQLVDTIDYEHSKCQKSSVIVAVYSLKKIQKLNLDFFPKHDEIYNNDMGKKTPYFVDSMLIASYELRKAIKKAGLRGIQFREVLIIDDVEGGTGECALKFIKDK